MEDTVASMVMTTPLRNPREGCVPIPITSMPSGVISPTMQQIFVVPMSSPTTISPFFGAMSLPLVRKRGGGLIGARRVVEVDARGPFATAAERRAHLRETAKLEGKVGGAEPDLLHAGVIPPPVVGDEGEGPLVVDPPFRERADREAGGAPKVEQVERCQEPQLRVGPLPALARTACGLLLRAYGSIPRRASGLLPPAHPPVPPRPPAPPPPAYPSLPRRP